MRRVFESRRVSKRNISAKRPDDRGDDIFDTTGICSRILVHTQDYPRACSHHAKARLGHTMETPSHNRPVTAGSLSRQRHAHSNDRDYNDDNAFEDDRPEQQRPPPVRPSTQRNTRSTPRAAAENARRLSGGNGPDEDAILTIRSEMEALKAKLRASDFAKSQAQVRRESYKVSSRVHFVYIEHRQSAGMPESG